MILYSFTTRPFVHDYWEEVYLLSGDLVRMDGLLYVVTSVDHAE